MCHTFKHFIHMQYFLLLSDLVIVFVHWVNTGVLYEPLECSLFWYYIPESKLCLCINLCRPSSPHSIRPIHKLLNSRTATCSEYCPIPDGEQPKTVLWLWVREMTWYLYTRECADEWRQNSADFKLLENCVMNGFIMFGIVFMTATGLETIRHSHLMSTLFHSLVPWWRLRRTWPQRTRLSQLENSPGELRNGQVANLQ